LLLKIDFAALHEVGKHWRGIATTLGINWLVKPFSMALLAAIFMALIVLAVDIGYEGLA
jgi:ACR3 family arsenite transporter